VVGLGVWVGGSGGGGAGGGGGGGLSFRTVTINIYRQRATRTLFSRQHGRKAKICVTVRFDLVTGTTAIPPEGAPTGSHCDTYLQIEQTY
jgi:hypothetical protein